MRDLWQLRRAQYKGLLMRCAPGTHEAAVALLMRQCALRSSVLDLGAGSGALLARLRDNGFTDLNAVDANAEAFRLEGVEPRAFDLNSEFADAMERPYRLITAIEIIEHVDSPRHFLRQAFEVLDQGGYLLLSTPNVANWLGRLQFLLTGRLRYFDRTQYLAMRHISPLPDVQVRLLLAETGFDLIDSITAGGFAGPLKRIAMAPVSIPFRLAFGSRAWGDVSIYLARKPLSDQRSGEKDSGAPR